MRFRLLPILALFALAACSDNTPEERLESAGERLDSTEDNLETIEQKIEQQEKALASLRKKRRELREKVLTLEERVAARATDVALFRAVQSALLDEESLSQAAISVDAESGVVRLSGLVSSEAEEAAAIGIAESVAGVDTVESRIEVEAAGAAKD